MALESDQSQYEHLLNHFESTDIPLWELDFTRIVQYLSNLHESDDLEKFFSDAPEEVFVCINRIITRRINPAMLKIYGAKSIEEFNAGMAWNFVEETIETIGSMLLTILKNRTGFQGESFIGSIHRKKQRAKLIWIVPDNGKKELDHIIFTIKLIKSEK